MIGGEFDQLAPVELGDLIQAWDDRQRREDRRFGVVATVIAEPNRNRRVVLRPYTPATFFSSLGDPIRKMTGAEMLEQWKSMFAGRTFKPKAPKGS